MSERPETVSSEPADWFATTHWSAVLAAGEGPTPAGREALEKLCTAYWYPLYAYIRRKGHNEQEAQDLTQDFFARLLSRNDFAAVHPSRGKFRAFLLAALNHFLANEWRDRRRLKRGGGLPVLSLDTANAENRYSAEPVIASPAEEIFDRQWALQVLEKAAGRLRAEQTRAGKEAQFATLRRFLSEGAEDGVYEGAAVQLGISVSGVASAVHRLRQRFRELVREEIGHTVATPREAEEELRYLVQVLGQ